MPINIAYSRQSSLQPYGGNGRNLTHQVVMTDRRGHRRKSRSSIVEDPFASPLGAGATGLSTSSESCRPTTSGCCRRWRTPRRRPVQRGRAHPRRRRERHGRAQFRAPRTGAPLVAASCAAAGWRRPVLRVLAHASSPPWTGAAPCAAANGRRPVRRGLAHPSATGDGSPEAGEERLELGASRI